MEKLRELMREAFDFVDTDKNGVLDRGEIEGIFGTFIKMFLKKAGINVEDLPEEAKEEMKKQTEEQCGVIMGQLDDNGDGKVTFDEFCKGAKVLAEMKNFA